MVLVHHWSRPLLPGCHHHICDVQEAAIQTEDWEHRRVLDVRARGQEGIRAGYDEWLIIVFDLSDNGFNAWIYETYIRSLTYLIVQLMEFNSFFSFGRKHNDGFDLSHVLIFLRNVYSENLMHHTNNLVQAIPKRFKLSFSTARSAGVVWRTRKEYLHTT